MRKNFKYFSIFVSGILLMLAITFYSNWRFEEEVLNLMANHVKFLSEKKDAESILLVAMNTCSYLEDRQTEILGNTEINPNGTGVGTNFIPSSFSAFDYGNGACGSYTLFLSRLLKKLGYRTKVVQLKVKEKWGGHISLVVEYQGKLLLLDPFYNFAFKDSLGHLSDINEVAKNWQYYSKHLPANYQTEFDYQSGWRFTNWDKYGFFSRSIYQIGALLFGKKKMDEVSVRYLLLGRNKYYCILSFIGFILFSTAPWFRKIPGKGRAILKFFKIHVTPDQIRA